MLDPPSLSVRLPALRNSRTAGQILMTFQ